MGTPFLDANSPTVKNLEAAVAGESMAHIKYRYFAKLCREMGDEESAKAFEATAEQEAMHAFGHLDLLFPKEKMSPSKALQFAIDGETVAEEEFAAYLELISSVAKHIEGVHLYGMARPSLQPEANRLSALNAESLSWFARRIAALGLNVIENP